MLVGAAALAAPRSPVVSYVQSCPSARSFRPAFFLRELAPVLIELKILTEDVRLRYDRSARLDLISNADLIALGQYWGLFESAAEFWREHRTRGELIEALYWAYVARGSRSVMESAGPHDASSAGQGGGHAGARRGTTARAAPHPSTRMMNMGSSADFSTSMALGSRRVSLNGSYPNSPTAAVVAAGAATAVELPVPRAAVEFPVPRAAYPAGEGPPLPRPVTRADEYELARAKQAAARAAAARAEKEDAIGVHDFMKRHEHFTLPTRVGGPVNRCVGVCA